MQELMHGKALIGVEELSPHNGLRIGNHKISWDCNHKLLDLSQKRHTILRLRMLIYNIHGGLKAYLHGMGKGARTHNI